MADADFLISHYQNEKRRRNFIACSSELEMCMFFIPNNLMMNKKWKMCKMALKSLLHNVSMKHFIKRRSLRNNAELNKKQTMCAFVLSCICNI